MKKITLALVAMIGYAAITAQPTRLVLFEEFTQASCGPCASQNPAFNALLAANSAKVISIKYQTSWPGVDPMNAANPVDAQARVTYYSVSGVPWSAMDGSATTGGSYSGAPANATAAAINTRYAVAPGLALLATHTLNSTYDSVQIAVNISNSTSSAFSSGSSGSLKLHTVIVEEEINYATAPGSNGETDFYNVMRKMLPNAGGTALADSWAIGASQTFVFNVSLPTYIANLGEIAIVAFVQDNSNKDVINAAYSAPQAVTGLPDAGIVSVSASTTGLCDPNLTPSVTFKNASTIAITSATLSYTLNGGTPVNQAWTGNLAANQTATVTFPQTTLSGSTVVVASVSNPNGTADFNGTNNTSSPVSVNLLDATPQTAPKNMDMETTPGFTLPSELIFEYTAPSEPLLVVVSKANVNGLNYEIGGFGQSTKSIIFDFYSWGHADVGSLTMQKIDLTSLTTPKLMFTHAYAQYNTSATSQNERFEVLASTDCGSTWTSLFNKGGGDLATTTPKTTRLFPTASEWVTTTLDLSSYANTSDLVIKFKGTSVFNGNSLYLDNIWIANGALGLDEPTLAGLNTYPNPASDMAKVEIDLSKEAMVGVNVYSNAGQLVIAIDATLLAAGTHGIDLNVGDLANGMYTAQVNIDGAIRSVRLSVAH